MQSVAPEPLGTEGHVPLHFEKWLGTGGTRKGQGVRYGEGIGKLTRN